MLVASMETIAERYTCENKTMRFIVLLTAAIVLMLNAAVVSTAGSSTGRPRAVESAAAPIVPFKIHVSDGVLTDLKRRLAQTRFADDIPGSGWDYGTDARYIHALIAYWRDTFDWRAQERRLNRFEQFKMNVDGLDIHFIRQRAKSGHALPIIFVHGYPDSFVTYTKVIDELTDPAAHGGRAADAFDVVVPSLPGYGFSERPREAGWGAGRVAITLTTLMARLGYTRYAVHGAGLGCMIGTQMALHDPTHVVAAHFNDCPLNPRGQFQDGAATPVELQRAKAREAELANEQAYLEMNSAKPQTVAYELIDSPVGLAAWIVDKYRAWCDCDGNPERKFTKDELLTNVTLYWVTETAGSAGRIFRENRQDSRILEGRVSVPTAYMLFPKDTVLPARAAMEARYNIARWTEMPRGGHFVALEEPLLLVEDLRAFLRGRR